MESQQVNEAYYKVPVAEASVPERLAFLKKVYGLLALSIIVAAGGAVLTLLNAGFQAVVTQNMILFIVLEFVALGFAMFAKKNETLAFIALFSFTGLTGIVTAPLLAMYIAADGGATIVLQALTMTGAAFIGLSLYALTSKKDFNYMGGALTMGLIVLIVGGLMNALFFHSSGMSMLMSFGGVFIFCGFILYDTSNIMRHYPTDEYISATLSLYLDVLNLFLFILRILGGSRD